MHNSLIAEYCPECDEVTHQNWDWVGGNNDIERVCTQCSTYVDESPTGERLQFFVDEG